MVIFGDTTFIMKGYPGKRMSIIERDKSDVTRENFGKHKQERVLENLTE